MTVDGRTVGEISTGLVVLLGIAEGDGEEEARWLVRKMVELRIFEDEEGRMNLSLADVQGEVLLVSQFTLLADTRKGRRPSFTRAAPPDVGEALYRRTADLLREEGIEVATGEFGARMLVEIRNEGPVTILLDSNDRSRSRSA